MRHKEKEGKRATFYLSEESLKFLDYYSSLTEQSKSAFLDWLINNFGKINSIKERIKEIEKKERILIERLAEINKELKQINTIKERLKKLEPSDEELEKMRHKQEEKAIGIISRAILNNNDYLEIQRLAKTWALLLNTTPELLLSQALFKIKNIGENNG